MLCLDVNVLVHAHVAASPHHHQVRGWLAGALRSAEPIAVPLGVLAGFWRVVTHRALFQVPATIDEAVAFTDWLTGRPRVLVPPASARHYQLSRDLVVGLGLSGADVPDAVLAATALDLSATLVTSDRGFRRFPGLSVLDPTQDPGGAPPEGRGGAGDIPK